VPRLAYRPPHALSPVKGSVIAWASRAARVSQHCTVIERFAKGSAQDRVHLGISPVVTAQAYLGWLVAAEEPAGSLPETMLVVSFADTFNVRLVRLDPAMLSVTVEIDERTRARVCLRVARHSNRQIIFIFGIQGSDSVCSFRRAVKLIVQMGRPSGENSPMVRTASTFGFWVSNSFERVLSESSASTSSK
jgi:hypothetical protein